MVNSEIVGFVLFIILGSVLFSWMAPSFSEEKSETVNTTHVSMSGLAAIQFRVYGQVQGVFFRKYTQKKAQELLLKGWVRNVKDGSVEGVAEGEPKAIDKMKDWLRNVGSPKSVIEKCDITEIEVKGSFTDFIVTH